MGTQTEVPSQTWVLKLKYLGLFVHFKYQN